MNNATKISKNKTMNNPNRIFPDLTFYPPSEDIYNMDKKESEIDPEDISRTKISNANDGKRNEKSFNEDKSGDDLDIPGSELDDEQEKIGSEDEENHVYSIGGDNHHNLEDDHE